MQIREEAQVFACGQANYTLGYFDVDTDSSGKLTGEEWWLWLR